MMRNPKIYIVAFSLLAFLVSGNYLYENFFYEDDLQKYSEVINQIRAVGEDTDILYIGESSNNTFHPDDNDKRAISEMLIDYLPEMEICDITYPASHAGTYFDILRAIPGEKKINTVVVTLNLRSFNAQWIYSDLETQLQKSMVLLKPYPPLFNRFLLSFKAYDNKTKEERKRKIRHKWKHDKLVFPEPFHVDNTYDWDGYHWRHGGKQPDGTFDKALRELACHYVKGYGFQINTNRNPRIKDFDRIITLAERRGWNLVFNLLAENTQKADEIIGSELTYFMEYNRKLLYDYFTGQGVKVVDNFYIAPDNQFIDQYWTTEHYREDARKDIAENLAEAIKQILYNNN